jgi:hypothetical protein
MNLNDSRTHSEYNVLQNKKKELKILIVGDWFVSVEFLFSFFLNYDKKLI